MEQQLQQTPQGLLAQPAQGAQPSGEFTDAEIKAVNLMIRQGCQVLLKDDVAEGIAASAKTGDPAKAVAEAVVPVLKQVYEAAKMAGGDLDQKVIVLAGRELAKIVVAVLGATGIIPNEQAGQIADQAFKMGIQMHNESVGGVQ